MSDKKHQTGHITAKSKNKIIVYSVIITVIYFSCFAFLSTYRFQDDSLGPFFRDMVGVFMSAGAIAVITGLILVVQSVIESERDKKQKVFDQKLALYSGIIDQMEAFYKLQDGEEVALIDEHERMDLFFTQLKVALLSRPQTFRSYSRLINDISDDNGVIKEEASKLLLNFIVDARNDLDVQEEMSPEDQKSFDEGIEIAEKAAENIQKTGRGTYFVSDDPFQQYLDQFLSPEGRKSCGYPNQLAAQKLDESALSTIKEVHSFIKDNFRDRPGVNFDYTRTGGMAGFALGKKRNAKFVYLRFEVFQSSDAGLFSAQSPHGYEFYRINLTSPTQFTDELKELVEESFRVRNEGFVTEERKPKKELIALWEKDLERFRQQNVRGGEPEGRREVVVLYLLKSPANEYQVPRLT